MLRRRLLLTALAVAGFISPAAVLARTQPEDKYFNSDGTRIRYVDLGSGEPVVSFTALEAALSPSGWTPGF